MKKDLVILLHGTWGRGMFFKSKQAEWTRSDSDLCKVYSEVFGKDVEFVVQNWSGSNYFRAREKAVRELQEKLIEISNSNQSKRNIHICAHSHGGNIAMMALNRLNGVMPRSLVCLSTPFILASQRDLSSRETRRGLLSIGFVLLYLAVLYALNMNARLFPTEIDLTHINTLFMIGVISLIYLCMYIFKKKIERWTQPLVRSIASFEHPNEPLCKTLLLRSDGDEAKLVLSTVQLLSTILKKLQRTSFPFIPSSYSELETGFGVVKFQDNTPHPGDEEERFWLNRITGYLQRHYLITYYSRFSFLVKLPLCLFLIFLIDVTTRAMQWGKFETVSTALLVLLLIHYVLPLFILVFGYALTAIASIVSAALEISRATLLAFFGIPPWIGLLCNISVESTPQGRWEVNQIISQSKNKHATHTDKEALLAMKNWLEGVKTGI